MQFTNHTDYALRILIYLMSNPTRTSSTREISEAYGVSLHHLTKVAKSLVQGGWLLSTRGGNGGLRLAAHTPEAKIGDIVRYTENTLLVVCFTPKNTSCPIASVCQLKTLLYRARRAFFDVLDAATVADIARNPADLNLILAPSPDSESGIKSVRKKRK
jgi:Rrf2 family transcriptional regulator, nitric oxide-sensitive transcriptional repressor